MELGRPTLIPHLLYLKNYVLFKFQFGNIAAPQVQKQILVHLPHFTLYDKQTQTCSNNIKI